MNFPDRLSQEIPKKGGGYVIILYVEKTIWINLFKKLVKIEPGFYAYVGSACGPGGLRARILRHLKRSKKIRWHIDRITSNVSAKAVRVIYSDKVQGNLFERRVSSCLFSKGLNYIERFGSSDDRENVSHLFYSRYLDILNSALKECITEITNDYRELVVIR